MFNDYQAYLTIAKFTAEYACCLEGSTTFPISHKQIQVIQTVL